MLQNFNIFTSCLHLRKKRQDIPRSALSLLQCHNRLVGSMQTIMQIARLQIVTDHIHLRHQIAEYFHLLQGIVPLPD